MLGAVCKGCAALGTACGDCERCRQSRAPRAPHFTTTHPQTVLEALRAAGLIPPDAVRVQIDAEVGKPAYVYYETAGA